MPTPTQTTRRTAADASVPRPRTDGHPGYRCDACEVVILRPVDALLHSVFNTGHHVERLHVCES